MKRIILFLVAMVLWLLITWNLNWESVLVGAGVAILTALVFGKRFVENPRKWLEPSRYFWLSVYVPYFLWECVKANFDVAYRVLHPAMPIKPGIVKVKTDLQSDIAKTALANSITMTPGTLSVDIIGEYIYVHWIYVRDQEVEGATVQTVQRFEKFLKRIFD